MTPTHMHHSEFNDLFDRVILSDGKEALPNVKEITDPEEALKLIKRASIHYGFSSPYYFRIRNFDPPLPPNQTHETCWYPKIFRNAGGMADRFDGSGVILTAGHNGVPKVFTFAMCEHVWDTSGSNHSRGWHPKRCTKCKFDASIDSGD